MQPIDESGRQRSGEVCHDVVQSGCRTPVGARHGVDKKSGRTDEKRDEHGDDGLLSWSQEDDIQKLNDSQSRRVE